MSTYIQTIAGRVIFESRDDFDLFLDRYSNLFTADGRVISTDRGVGTPRQKRDISRDLRVVRIPRLRFRMDFSPWNDDEVLRADDFGFVITCTDNFQTGSYLTPEETQEVELDEWAVENGYPAEPEESEFDSFDDWFQKHDTWEDYIEDAYHGDHRDVLPDLPGTLQKESWQTTLDRYHDYSDDGGIEELFN